MSGGPRVLGIVLAGGEGKRLAPLTQDRAKPAVPFGGIYRLVDFVLSNLVNGAYVKLAVLTQYKSHSLDRHVTTAWRLSPMLGNYVTPVPAQMRRGPRWFAGSADAIYQNLNLIYDERPDYVCVFGADHIYRMDPRQMIEAHIDSGAGVTVAGIRVSIGVASAFGVIEPDQDGRHIHAFLEKPSDPAGLPDAPDQVFASMGNYLFTAQTLIEAVTMDASDEGSKHDVGGDLIPMLVDEGVANVYDFATNHVPGATDLDRAYWRDVGTLDSYYQGHLDLLGPQPSFNLHNRDWPILTWNDPAPPARLRPTADATGTVEDSLISQGAVIEGTVARSVIGPDVKVRTGASVEGCVLMNHVDVASGAVVRNAIVDKGVMVPEGAAIGVDLDLDRSRFTVSEGGVVAIGKRQKVE
ncbi:MAG TPA: glucose-1-phosphate adenylyltransferase [Actinomycetota bacterium]|nr:glucose-1-phosphate adenylyltransferase [Actinomycetota bacterium]